jgi:ubiquinone/menaquinone biosynthesis C-methylase UbiE
VIYEHPLAYLLGLEGIALLRAWAGDQDKAFVQARLAEVRRLLDNEALVNHPGVEVARGDVVTGYRQWAPTYDGPRNSLFDCDEPIVHELFDALPPGIALDAACGTGRFAEYLASRGHHVVGVDRSPEMLGHARVRVPDAAFLVGELQQLPLPDNAVDAVACGIALAHVPALAPVMAEFARVLRPRGHLVISDIHHERVLLGSVVEALGPAGEPGVVRTYRHTAGDFLRAALPAGFQVRRCEEPRAPERGPDHEDRSRFRGDPPPPRSPDVLEVGAWDEWPWSLMDLVPEATAAVADSPVMIVWHFQLADD